MIAALNLFLIMLGESDIQSASPVQLDIDAALFEQIEREGRIHVPAGAGELEKAIGAVGFGLWGQHAAGSGRGLGAEGSAFNYWHIRDATARQRSSYAEADDAASDDHHIGNANVWVLLRRSKQGKK